MTHVHHPTFKYYGQHRRKAGDAEMRCVEAIWQRYHPGIDPTPIKDLGRRPHAPQHALNPTPQKVYL